MRNHCFLLGTVILVCGLWIANQNWSPPTFVDTSENVDWSQYVDRRVIVKGMAVDRKISATLEYNSGSIFIDDSWPQGFCRGGTDGEFVTVTGTVARRSMLPVFIERPGTEELRAGIGMPEGTDLEEAAKAYILEDVEWERSGPPARE